MEHRDHFSINNKLGVSLCYLDTDMMIDALIMLLTIQRRKGGNGLTIENTDLPKMKADSHSVKHLDLRKSVSFTISK